MTKKTYIKPSLQVERLQRRNVIATSAGSKNVTINLNLDDQEEEGYAD